MTKTADGRLAYADLLRCVASLAVIFLHVCGAAFGDFAIGSGGWNVLNLFDGLVHWCVPIFVMLSGMFLLDPKKALPPLSLLRHLLRILVALLFWGMVYALADFLLAGGSLSAPSMLSCLKSVLWGNTHYHLWFLYTILGLYLITPLLRAFVRGASRSDFHYCFLLIFLFCSVLFLALRLRPSQTASAWLRSCLYLGELAQIGLCYVGYYLAGYYLKNFTLGRLAEFIIYLLGIFGAVVTVWGNRALSLHSGWANLEFYNYNAPNVVFMAVAVFVLFRYLLGVSEERGRRRSVSAVAKVSFGIYLVHELFLMLLKEWGISAATVLTPALSVPLIALGVFAASFAVAWLLSKIPFLGKYLT
ncbi:MAG: acyltransferase family protein [Pseudoflavonifractor sp.]